MTLVSFVWSKLPFLLCYCQWSKIGGMQGRPGIFFCLCISSFAMCTYVTTRVKGKACWFEGLIVLCEQRLTVHRALVLPFWRTQISGMHSDHILDNCILEREWGQESQNNWTNMLFTSILSAICKVCCFEYFLWISGTRLQCQQQVAS